MCPPSASLFEAQHVAQPSALCFFHGHVRASCSHLWPPPWGVRATGALPFLSCGGERRARPPTVWSRSSMSTRTSFTYRCEESAPEPVHGRLSGAIGHSPEASASGMPYRGVCTPLHPVGGRPYCCAPRTQWAVCPIVARRAPSGIGGHPSFFGLLGVLAGGGGESHARTKGTATAAATAASTPRPPLSPCPNGYRRRRLPQRIGRLR